MIFEWIRRGGGQASPFIYDIPSWLVSRILGLLSYFLLFCGISLGISYGMPIWKSKQRAQIYKWHTFFTISGVFCGILHPFFLVIDHYEPFTWSQILLPFTAPNDPFFYGLGTVTLYGFLILVLIADLRGKLSRKVWRTIHLSAYSFYLIGLAHGMYGGTDTHQLWVFFMYCLTFSIILSLMIAQGMMMTDTKKMVIRHK